jgi:hypothetical protein
MKKIKIDNREVTLISVTQHFAGYGRRKIICFFEHSGVDFSISATTNDMHAFDRAMDIDDYEERQIALYDIIKYKIEEEILSEMYEIDEE